MGRSVDNSFSINDITAETCIHHCYKVSVESTPNNYFEAISSIDKQNWTKAMEEEISSLHENGTYSIVSLPEGKKAIGSRWVFAI